ncbi:MAG TPA: hypothetical protein PLZ36_13485 [Armatimonadota bacterium]|nr:hypothetical protein [Armatimonadota bacterium]
MHLTAMLPDLLTFADGRPVRAPEEWPARRAELLQALLDIQYGHLPPAPEAVSAYPLYTYALFRDEGVNGTHYRLTMQPGGYAFHLQVVMPAGEGPFPLVIDGDGCWRKTLTDDVLRAVTGRGYALAIFNRVEIVPDRLTPRDTGLYTAYPGDYGALAAWAWAYHRVVDAVPQLGAIDPARVIVTGHSRGGKTALLAGATDERIALTAPNNSGCGGAGCYRFPDESGERLADLLRNIPYWFAPRLRDFLDREAELPFDQHSLKAAVAPRALLTTEARGDHWASPSGTRLTHEAAREVYRFLGAEHRIGIHYRDGGHAHTLADWHTLLDFADTVFDGKPMSRDFDMHP